MSYCVNCGVELDKSAGECPLCVLTLEVKSAIWFHMPNS